jgi:cytochrome P450
MINAMTASNACPFQVLSRSFELSNEELEQIYIQAHTKDGGVHFLDDIGYWVITKYADVKKVMGNQSLFSPEIAMQPYQPLSPESGRILMDGAVAPTRLMVDNPNVESHRRARRIVQSAFTPQRLNALIPAIEKLTDDAIDSFINDGKADLVGQMLYELPALVLFKLMGIGDEHVKHVKHWADNRLLFVWGRLTPEKQIAAARELVDYWRFCNELIEARLAAPQDDFTSALVHAQENGQRALNDNEVADIVFGLLLAGHETTSNQSANTILSILQTPGTWARLVSNPTLIPKAVEEGLRFRPSVIAWRRKALSDCEIGGQPIPQDASLLVMLAAGNRDAELFAAAERFDIDRVNAKEHVSFGSGPHFCLGAPLARLELKVILEKLTRRIPSLRLVPSQPLKAIETIQFRGPTSLLVEWD